jgi:hypothetical protein
LCKSENKRFSINFLYTDATVMACTPTEFSTFSWDQCLPSDYYSCEFEYNSDSILLAPSPFLLFSFLLEFFLKTILMTALSSFVPFRILLFISYLFFLILFCMAILTLFLILICYPPEKIVLFEKVKIQCVLSLSHLPGLLLDTTNFVFSIGRSI